MSKSDTFEPASVPTLQLGRRWLWGALLVAVVGLLVLVGGWLVDPTRTAFAYLVAFVTCLSTCLGALIFLAIVHAMNARWPVAVRRLVEALVVPLLLLAVAFIPIAMCIEMLYPWSWASERLPHHLAELLAKKAPYFEPAWFWGRAALYFVVWLAVALPLLWWSARQDRDNVPSLRIRQRIVGAAGLPLLALTLTFASFDWVMSLHPAWYSTMFGVYVFAGGFVAALALLTIIVTLADLRGQMATLLRPSHYYALGRLLLAFVIFWAYITFFQFMLMWMANKPEEVSWYIARSEHGWQWVALTIIVLHFAVPFLVLLSYRIKWRPRALSVIAALIVLAHWIEIHWMIVPATGSGVVVHWVDFGAMALFAGACVGISLWWLGGRPAAPRWDPMLPKGVRYESA